MIGTKIEFDGPFFRLDPVKRFRQNAREGLAALAEEGEDMIRSGAPVLTGDFREGVIGRVRSLSGKPWALTAVVSQQHVEPWPGTRKPKPHAKAEYRGGKVERRLGLFKKAARVLRRGRRELNNLLKGLT